MLSTWFAGNQRDDLNGDDVHIWRVACSLAASPDISDEEQERAGRFLVEDSRRRFVSARAALRKILARYLRTSARDLFFIAGPHGKPELEGHALSFNVSHAGDYALIAVTRRLAVGIDIERISPSRSSAEIAARFFSPAEQAALAACPESDRTPAFFRIWTRKEAVIKALGDGLACPLASFDVSADRDQARLLSFRREGVDIRAWSLFAIEAAPGYAAALAVMGQPGAVRGFDFVS